MTTHAISKGAREFNWPSLCYASSMLRVRILRARRRGSRRVT